MLARQSTARSFLIGPILDSDGVAKTDEVVASFKVTKNGTVGSPNASSTLTHSHTGHYVYAAAADDFDTLGEVEFSLNSGTNAMAPKSYQVVSAARYDADITSYSVARGLAGSNLDATITSRHASGAAVAKSPATLAAGDVTGNVPADVKAFTVQPEGEAPKNVTIINREVSLG